MSLSVTPEAAIAPGMGAGVVPVAVTEAAIRAVVYIYTRSPHGKGSGTLTRLPTLGDGKVLLLTCHHVIPDKETAARCSVSIDRYNDKSPGMTFSGEELFDLSTFKTDTTNDSKWGKLLDFTIIGVKMDVLEKANLPGGPPKPLLLTDYQNMKEEQLKVNDQISVVHFPQYPPGFQRCINTLNIIKIEGPIFSHNATTYGGSSGCPIFREYQERWVIVGLHRAELKQKSVAYTNLATHISAVCDAYMDIPYSGRVPYMAEFGGQMIKEYSEECSTHPATNEPGQAASNDVPAQSRQHTADTDENTMAKWNEDALHSLLQDLKLHVIVKTSLINKLHKAAGGFMDGAEVQKVRSKPSDAEQMEEIVQTLLGKGNAEFNIFCTLLHNSNYSGWAKKLERKAIELRGQPGT